MALYEFKLPDIGEGVTEGEIVEWHVSAGQAVQEDDPMVEVMTDKATVTIGAPKTGTIKEARFGVGDIAPVGDVLVVMELEGAGDAPSSADQGAAAASPAPAAEEARPAAGGGAPREQVAPSPGLDVAASAVGDIREGLPGTAYFKGGDGAGARGDGQVNGHGDGAGYFDDKPLATPATRKLARDLSVDLRTVPPTGDGGRVTKEDVQRAAGRAASAPGAGAAASDAGPARAAGGASAPQPGAGRAPVSIQAPSAEAQALEERKPFVGIRRKIAERMQTAKNTAAHFSFVEECHVDRLVELRARMKPVAEEQGVKLTYLPFIVKAVVAALRKHPVLNSALDETTNELVYRRYYDLGIAAQTDQGLMVPVLRGADRLSIVEIARELARLGDGARNGTLSPAELSGSTFTITSLGKTGGLFATPVLNLPEVGILGVHQMKERPVVRDGAIEIGQVMLLSLTLDHRIVDGAIGAAFAYEVIGLLEDPDRLFLEMS